MPSPLDVCRLLCWQALGSTTVPNIDLSGRTIVVTGANTGLGLDAAKHLVRMNVSRLVLGCRNLKKGEAAKSAILSEAAPQGRPVVEVWEVDLDQFGSVLAFCKRVRSLDRLDGFIANAGVEVQSFETSELLEKSLTVNVVSTYLMAIAVLPKLQETSSAFAVNTRLSFTGSTIHIFGPDKQLEMPAGQDIFARLSDRKTADIPGRYNLSKLIEHQIFLELIKHLPASSEEHQVIVNLVNPGWCATELGRAKEMGLFERTSFSLIGRTSEEGSRTLVHASTAGRETHGRYLSECTVKPQSAYVNSQRGTVIGHRLWEQMMQRVQQIDPKVAAFVE